MGNAHLEDALYWSWEFTLLHQYIHFIIAHFRHSLVAYTRFSHTFYVTLCQPFAATGHKMYLVWQIVWDMFLRTAASLQPSVTPISKPPPPHAAPWPTPLPTLKCDMWRGVADLFAYKSADVHKKYTHTLSAKYKNKNCIRNAPFWRHFQFDGLRGSVAKWSAHWGSGRCGLQGAMRHLRVNKKYILNQKSEKFEK